MTAQVPDGIVVDGAAYRVMATIPLGPVRELLGPLSWPNTGLSRGYVAQWLVEGERLYLVSVTYFPSPRDRRLLELGPQPRHASWVSGQFRIAAGPVVRYVHGGFASRYEHERVVEVVEGRVRRVDVLARPAEFGAAGPFGLTERAGSAAVGARFAGTGPAGDPVIAKLATGATVDDPWRGEHVRGPDGRRRPPDSVVIAVAGATEARVPIDAALAVAVLEAEQELLDADAGRLLPATHGIWTHDLTGTAALVTERVEGRPIAFDDDIVAVLDALARAVRRGPLRAHGDLRAQHVLLADGRVRLTDPAPLLASGPRLVTPSHNPYGWTGAAADVAACGWIMRYALPQPNRAWEWARRVCDVPEPPDWAHRHADASRELRRCLDDPAPPPPIQDIPDMPLASRFGTPPRPGQPPPGDA